MTDLPVSAPIQTPTSAREARVDRFLARVAALTPRQWGELDAIGQRLEAADPIAWWERARHVAALSSALPPLEEVMRVVGFVANGVDGLARTLRGRRPGRLFVARPRRPSPGVAGWQLGSRMETLWDVAAAQPGGVNASLDCLYLALLALWMRDQLPARGFAQIYDLVEPVIPAATLDRA